MLERICGNAVLRQDLAGALRQKHMMHSILLVGEEGSGAGFAARCLAADFLFPQGGPHAEAVLRSESGECIEVRGEGASGEIPVEKVRAVRREVYGTALSSAGRCVIFYAAQNFNGPSANALLKVLEEPPEDVLFILTANSLAGVLPTIRSRCAVYVMAPVPQQECVRRLCEGAESPDAERAEFLAAVYDGHLGSCLAVLQDPARAEALERAQRLCRAAARGDEYELLRQLAELETNKTLALRVLSDCAALCAATLRGPGMTELRSEQAARVIEETDLAQKRLRRNAALKLTLTLFGASVSAAGGR